MKFLSKTPYDEDILGEEDPMNGVAQLFDISIAFIVAVIAAVFALQSKNPRLASQHSTATQKEAQTQTVSRKATSKKQSGKGKRLGTAYQLDNGEVIYVPDDQN